MRAASGSYGEVLVALVAVTALGALLLDRARSSPVARAAAPASPPALAPAAVPLRSHA